MIRTAVVMAAGRGTRMQRADDAAPLDAAQADAAAAGHKAMMPVGRPFLEYGLSALADAGITRVVLVVGPTHDALREHFTVTAPPTRVHVSFVVQPDALGTADAVVRAGDAVGGEPFLVLNADNLYPVEAVRALAALDGAGVVAFDRDALVRDGNIDAERVRTYAVLDIDGDDRLRGIVEKPGAQLDLASAQARWVGMNLWAMTPALVEACRRVPRSARGEFELPEAVALAIADGMPVHVVRVAAPVLDLSRRSDVAEVTARLAHITPRP